jgi:hypothetical protein
LASVIQNKFAFDLDQSDVVCVNGVIVGSSDTPQ